MTVATFRKARVPLKFLCTLLPVIACATVVGCGDDDDDTGPATGGSTGKGGSGGAGTGGKAASGGVSPTGGSKSTTGGTAGKGGTSSGGSGNAGAGGVPAGGAPGGAGGEPDVGGGAGGVPSGGSGGDVSEPGGAGGGGGEGGGAENQVNCVPDTNVQAKVLPLSTAGHDGLFGVTFDASGNIYATGYVQSGILGTDNRQTIVAKFDSTGAPVIAFGTNGVATVDVVAAGNGEVPRGIVLQSDGKIVVAGTVDHSATATGILANDRDVYALRLTTAGVLDTTFGTLGIKILNLHDGVEGTNAQGNPALLGADAQGSLSVDSTDRLLIFGQQRAVGLQSDGTTPRVDSDFALVRLTANGAEDATFATAGKFTYDIGQASVSARSATLLPDGSIVCAGYSTYSGTQRPVLFKLGPNGQGPSWVFSEPVGTAAEAYGAGLQSNGKFVTSGYGRPNAAATSSDVLSIRLTSFGTLDTTYGTNGSTWLDVGGYGDNGRTLLVLGDNRVLLAGGGRPKETDVDGLVAILTPEGKPDTAFAPGGCKTYDLGTTNDFFWGSALSANKSVVALVGLTGVPSASTDDNDSALLLLPVQ